MSSRPRKSPLLALVLVAVIALGACGDSHTKVSTGTYAGESGANAPYLDVGSLAYEVQLSRELNPFDTEDSSYLQGLSASELKLAPGQEWFAVFLQVFNNNSHSLPASEKLTITDTQGNRYTPIEPGPANEFAYRGGDVPGNGRLPLLDTIASNGPTQGALLLFKIQLASLANRPLKLTIVDARDAAKTASAELDV